MIGRALRVQARSFTGDVVLLGVVAAAFVMSLSLATSVPSDLAAAPVEARAAFIGPFRVVMATYGGVLAAVYGSFRYTIDRRDGVIAQRLTMGPRWALFLARVPAAAVGGAVVALAGVFGGHIALIVTMGGVPVEWSATASALAFGAVAGLWGLGLGVVVQVHLVALFVASMSMSAALLLAVFCGAVAAFLPPLVMLEAVGIDVTAVGIMPDDRLDRAPAVGVTTGWVSLALLVGGVSFMKRDVK
ncbi:hypothetical protein [Microbacterium sp. NPDC091662]|uniref:hypothetical protein n=1 Tax=Microbacterium sp. NPDC091662 TaxID=3364211 RepID=UPI0037F6B39B